MEFISRMAFLDAKSGLIKPTVLSHYNVAGETKLSADPSSYGLGVVVLQKLGAEWKPVIHVYVLSVSDCSREKLHRLKKRLWLKHGFVTNFLIMF